MTPFLGGMDLGAMLAAGLIAIAANMLRRPMLNLQQWDEPFEPDFDSVPVDPEP